MIRLVRAAALIAALAAPLLLASPAQAGTVTASASKPFIQYGAGYAFGSVSSTTSTDALHIQCHAQRKVIRSWASDYWENIGGTDWIYAKGYAKAQVKFTPHAGKQYRTHCEAGRDFYSNANYYSAVLYT